MRPKILVIDIATQTETVREMNDEEYAKHLESVAKAQAEAEAQQD